MVKMNFPFLREESEGRQSSGSGGGSAVSPRAGRLLAYHPSPVQVTE